MISPENNRYNMVLPRALMAKAKAKAKEMNITHSALIRMILTEWLMKHPIKNTAASFGELKKEGN